MDFRCFCPYCLQNSRIFEQLVAAACYQCHHDRLLHSQFTDPKSSVRTLHEMLVQHPIYSSGQSQVAVTSAHVALAAHELPSMGSPMPHLTPLRGPSLIPIASSPGHPIGSPMGSTLTQLGVASYAQQQIGRAHV